MDRVVIVSGASSGIGAATAQRFIRDGDMVYNFDVSRPLETAQNPETLRTVQVDVADWSAIKTAVELVEAECGRVDVTIANAGISRRRPIADIDRSSMEDVMRVNFFGVFGLWQASVQTMMKQGGGVLLATASSNGLVGYPLYADYNASKAAVISLCQSFALEYSPQVRAACVAPGYVMTPMQKAEYSRAALAEVNARIPLGRHATPDEIAGAFFFLASDEAAFLTGSVLRMDGGELAGGTASNWGTASKPPRGASRQQAATPSARVNYGG